MKSSELILKIQTLIDRYGEDFEVGFENTEFGCFESIRKIDIKEREKTYGQDWDDESLGEVFVTLSN